MKRMIIFACMLLLTGTVPCRSYAFQEDVTIVAPTSEAAQGLDLHAVAELFTETKDLEAFERALNDPETGINNLDLDDNGEVDYIRIVEEVEGDVHIIILQVPLGENEFQDVATIEVEKSDDDNINMQVHGNHVIYGADYYVQPTVVHVHTWPIITWLYRPVYRPYRSVFYFGFYPRWWRPYRPVTFTVYRTRTVRYTSRRTFTVGRTTRVTTVNRVKYKPASSTLVRKKTVRTTNVNIKSTKKVSSAGGGSKATTTRKVTATKTTKTGGKTTTTKVGAKKVTNPKTGKTTTKVGAKRTTKSKTGKTTTVGKGVRKTKNPKTGKTTTTKVKAKKTTKKSGGKKRKRKH